MIVIRYPLTLVRLTLVRWVVDSQFATIRKLCRSDKSDQDSQCFLICFDMETFHKSPANLFEIRTDSQIERIRANPICIRTTPNANPSTQCRMPEHNGHTSCVGLPGFRRLKLVTAWRGRPRVCSKPRILPQESAGLAKPSWIIRICLFSFHRFVFVLFAFIVVNTTVVVESPFIGVVNLLDLLA